MNNQNNIVDRIRTLANAQGYSLPNLEMKLNLGNGTISRWSKSSPNSDKLMRVADFFNVSIDYLLGRSPTDDSDYSRMVDTLSSPIHVNKRTTIRPSNLTVEDAAALAASLRDHIPFMASAEELEMIQRFRRLDSRGKAAVLNVLEYEYNALPGDKASASPKQA